MIAEFVEEKDKYYIVYGSKIVLETDCEETIKVCEETIKVYKTKEDADRWARHLLAKSEYRLAEGGKNLPRMMGYMRMLFML